MKPENIRVPAESDDSLLSEADKQRLIIDKIVYGVRYIGEVNGSLVRIDPVKVRLKDSEVIEYEYL